MWWLKGSCNVRKKKVALVEEIQKQETIKNRFLYESKKNKNK